jgi:hypothetical protein
MNRFAVLLSVLSLIALGGGLRPDDKPLPTVHGLVTDTDKKPLEGVCIRFKGSKQQSKSDAAGKFHLQGNGSRITGWKEGHFIGGASVNPREKTLLHLRPLPTEDNQDYAWVDPQPNKNDVHRCGNCHPQIYKEWEGSAHGRAATNRHFLNLYDGTDWHGTPGKGWNLLKEHPEGVSVCAGCHAPAVNFADPGYEDFRKLKGVDKRGVHCDYCHKIADTSLEKLGREHGRFAHRLLRPREGQLFFGPLDDVDRDEDAYSPLYQDSRYCASCHEGTVFGAKVYTTYSEWKASPAAQRGQQCQTCHMAPSGQMTNFAPGKGGIERDPLTLATHSTPGGDAAMLKRCLKVKTELRREGNNLRVICTVTASNVGHRVPTGFIDRNMSLVIEATSPQGQRLMAKSGPLLPEAAGAGNPEESNFAGLPGRFYAKLIADETGKSPIPFWRFGQNVADTRLHPEQPDVAAWSFPAEQTAKVRVRLVYRRFFKLTYDQKSWPPNDIIITDDTYPVPAR